MIAVAAKGPERPRAGRASIGLWLLAAAVAAGIGFGLATSPLLLFVAFVAVAAGASFVLAFNQPRWTFVIVLFLAEGYVPDVDATIVTRILDAGGEIVGKAVCEHLCFSGR